MKEIAVIFDMDGVLVENSEIHNEAWRLTCEKHGKTKTVEEIKELFGGTNKVFIENLLGITDEKQAIKIAEEKETLYRNMVVKELKAPKGLLEFLFDLKKNSVKLAVATSAPRINLDFILDKLEIRSFFDVLVDESLVTHGKPNPEVYIQASQKLGISPKNCVVIEDAIYGVQAGLAAGMSVIGITTTFKKEQLGIANMVIDNFFELNYSKINSLLS